MLSLRFKIVDMYRITIILAFLLSSILTLQSQNKYEIRATWLTTLGGMDWPSYKATSPAGIQRQKNELCQILDELKNAHFNTVLLQTRLRGDMIYPSVYETFAESLAGKTGRNPGYDPLRFAIEECHKRGMALHAWVVTIPIGNSRQIKLLGKNSVVRKQPSLCKQFNGSWYLDPGNPRTADYLSGIVKEIVQRYDVDGIHLDYIRYPEHGKNFPDQREFRKYGRGKSLNQWRRENITRIVRRLYTDVKSLKPWVVVSSSPVGKFNDTHRYRSLGWNAYQEVYQDAQGWLKEGIHDALFPMMYFKGNQFYPFALDWMENKNGRWIVPGLGVYFLHPSEADWKLDDVIKQVYFTRKMEFEGQAYFRNKFLLDNTKGLWDELKLNFYTTPAVTPPLSWVDNVAPEAPTLPSFTRSEQNILLKWNPSATHKAGGILYRVYASDSYPVDTQQADNLIANGLQCNEYCYIPSLPWMKRLFWAVTAVDRYGNESTALPLNQPQGNALEMFENRLPDIPDKHILVISDATGMEILRTKHSEPSILKQLKPGFYRISLIHPDGNKKLIGTLIR